VRQTGPTSGGRQARDDVSDVFILIAGLRGSGQSKAHLEAIGACLGSAHTELPELDASFGVGVGASLSVDCGGSHEFDRTRRPLLYRLYNSTHPSCDRRRVSRSVRARLVVAIKLIHRAAPYSAFRDQNS
jgi:hypothetical protein